MHRIALFLLCLLACRAEPRPPADAEITVAAAADLARAMPDLTAAFEAFTGMRVIATLGSSGMLAQQISNGAPVDVFLSADTGWVGTLERQGRTIPGTRAPYAVGRLVLLFRDGLTGVQHIQDLAKHTVRRVAIANPEHAPYGRAARAALERAGVLAAVEPKLVLGDNVRQTLQYAETGNVDVAIVALALIDANDPRGVPVPDSLYRPIVQELVVIAQRPHEAAAKRFAEFVLSAEGRAVLQRHRFEPPPAR